MAGWHHVQDTPKSQESVYTVEKEQFNVNVVLFLHYE